MTSPIGGAGAATPPADELAIVGRVRKAHGIRGELVVEALTNEPAAVFAAGRRLFGGTPEGRPLSVSGDPRRAGAPLVVTVAHATPFKGGWIVRVQELADRTAAEAWRERTLLAPLAELPPPSGDQVYLHELVGMRVVRGQGEARADVGEVVDYYELPHALMLEVKRADTGALVLVPYRPEIVVEVDTQARVVTLDPPEGLLE